MFQLAMESVNSSQGTSSQRTKGAAMICDIKSCALMPVTELEEQELGPSHHMRSTPL